MWTPAIARSKPGEAQRALGVREGGRIDAEAVERLAGAGRAVRHQLTARGRELLERGDALANRVLTASFAALSPRQIDHLGELLELMMTAPID